MVGEEVPLTGRADERMTVADFLQWDGGDPNRRYELRHGIIMVRMPSRVPHAVITGNAGWVVRTKLTGSCRAYMGAGILIDDENYLTADVAVDCSPPADTPHLEAPVLIIEVLSASTRRYDRTEKLDAYQGLPAVREVWLIDSSRRWLQIHWRDAADLWNSSSHVGRGTLATSPLLAVEIALDELYEGAAVP